MLYLPPLRRMLLPSLICLAFILYYRSSVIPSTSLSYYLIRQPHITRPQGQVPRSDLSSSQLIASNISLNYQSPPTHIYYPYNLPDGEAYQNGTKIHINYDDPATHPYLQQLFKCPIQPNRKTGHVRLPFILHNITVIFNNETDNERKGYLNPAIISLPHWSKNQYLLISRVVTDGSHQHNLICEANICSAGNPGRGEEPCDERSLELLGGQTGMRCAGPPLTLNVPPTPAASCGYNAGILMDIPGFHDPRVFYSGKGEPLMMVNSQSRYSCFGLWIIDLRRLFFPLDGIMSGNPSQSGAKGPLMSYPSLTELTRNPAYTRGLIEKNWMFFSSHEGSYIHYDMGHTKRTFAKLLGGGITTVNLTDPYEQPCLEDAAKPDPMGTWHQGTNSLRLILCDRKDEHCRPTENNQVFFSLIHHKHKSLFDLPLRYERYFMVWSAAPPFHMLGISKHAILFANETAQGFNEAENWDDDPEHQRLVSEGKPGKKMYGGFTYSVSIAWAWGRENDEPQDKNTGYLDEEVIIGVGLDDAAMKYAKVEAKELLACLRACPGRGTSSHLPPGQGDGQLVPPPPPPPPPPPKPPAPKKNAADEKTGMPQKDGSKEKDIKAED